MPRKSKAILEVEAQVNDLLKLLNQLKQTERTATKTARAFGVMGDRSQKANAGLNRYSKSAQRAKMRTQQLAASFNLVRAAMFAVPVVATIQGFRALGRQAVALDRAMLGVEKTTGLSGEALAQYRDQLIGLSNDIGVSVERLAELSENAGALGVSGAQNLEKFTRKVSALVVSTDLGVDNASNTLARLINLTGVDFTQGVEEASNALSFLEDNISATGSEIASAIDLIAPKIINFTRSTADIIAIAGTSAAAGQRASTVGTAFQTVFENLEQSIDSGNEAFAAIAQAMNLSVEGAVQAYRQDRVLFTAQLAERLNDFSATQQTTILEGLGSIGRETRAAFVALGPQLVETLRLSRFGATTDYAAEQQQLITTSDSGRLDIAVTKTRNAFIELGDLLLESALPAIERFAGFLNRAADQERNERRLRQNEELAAFFGGTPARTANPILGALGGAAAQQIPAIPPGQLQDELLQQYLERNFRQEDGSFDFSDLSDDVRKRLLEEIEKTRLDAKELQRHTDAVKDSRMELDKLTDRLQERESVVRNFANVGYESGFTGEQFPNPTGTAEGYNARRGQLYPTPFNRRTPPWQGEQITMPAEIYASFGGTTGGWGSGFLSGLYEGFTPSQDPDQIRRMEVDNLRRYTSSTHAEEALRRGTANADDLRSRMLESERSYNRMRGVWQGVRTSRAAGGFGVLFALIDDLNDLVTPPPGEELSREAIQLASRTIPDQVGRQRDFGTQSFLRRQDRTAALRQLLNIPTARANLVPPQSGLGNTDQTNRLVVAESEAARNRRRTAAALERLGLGEGVPSGPGFFGSQNADAVAMAVRRGVEDAFNENLGRTFAGSGPGRSAAGALAEQEARSAEEQREQEEKEAAYRMQVLRERFRATREVEEEINKTDMAIKSMIGGIGNTFAAEMQGVFTNIHGLGEVWDAVLQQMRADIYNNFLRDHVQTFGENLFGGIISGVGDLFTGGGGSGVGPAGGPVPPAARGGDVRRGGLVMVGERGAELVSLPTGARVHPNGTGPGSPTYIFQGTGIDEAGVRRVAEEVVQGSYGAFRDGLTADLRRNSAYAQAAGTR